MKSKENVLPHQAKYHIPADLSKINIDDFAHLSENDTVLILNADLPISLSKLPDTNSGWVHQVGQNNISISSLYNLRNKFAVKVKFFGLVIVCQDKDEISYLKQKQNYQSPSVNKVFIDKDLQKEFDKSNHSISQTYILESECEDLKKYLEPLSCIPILVPYEQADAYLQFTSRFIRTTMHNISMHHRTLGGVQEEKLDSQWECYNAVNTISAKVMLAHSKSSEDIFLIHDYEFLLVPTFLRALKSPTVPFYKQIQLNNTKDNNKCYKSTKLNNTYIPSIDKFNYKFVIKNYHGLNNYNNKTNRNSQTGIYNKNNNTDSFNLDEKKITKTNSKEYRLKIHNKLNKSKNNIDLIINTYRSKSSQNIKETNSNLLTPSKNQYSISRDSFSLGKRSICDLKNNFNNVPKLKKNYVPSYLNDLKNNNLKRQLDSNINITEDILKDEKLNYQKDIYKYKKYSNQINLNIDSSSPFGSFSEINENINELNQEKTKILPLNSIKDFILKRVSDSHNSLSLPYTNINEGQSCILNNKSNKIIFKDFDNLSDKKTLKYNKNISHKKVNSKFFDNNEQFKNNFLFAGSPTHSLNISDLEDNNSFSTYDSREKSRISESITNAQKYLLYSTAPRDGLLIDNSIFTKENHIGDSKKQREVLLKTLSRDWTPHQYSITNCERSSTALLWQELTYLLYRDIFVLNSLEFHNSTDTEINISRNIGLIFNSPFPSSDIFSTLHFRYNLLHGILDADVISFQFFSYTRHFLNTVKRLLHLSYMFKPGGVIFLQHGIRSILIRTGLLPISYRSNIDMYFNDSVLKESQRIRSLFPKQILIGSVDNCDQYSGILQKIRGFTQFLKYFPNYIGKVTLILRVLQSPYTDPSNYFDLVSYSVQIANLLISLLSYPKEATDNDYKILKKQLFLVSEMVLLSSSFKENSNNDSLLSNYKINKTSQLNHNKLYCESMTTQESTNNYLQVFSKMLKEKRDILGQSKWTKTCSNRFASESDMYLNRNNELNRNELPLKYKSYEKSYIKTYTKNNTHFKIKKSRSNSFDTKKISESDDSDTSVDYSKRSENNFYSNSDSCKDNFSSRQMSAKCNNKESFNFSDVSAKDKTKSKRYSSHKSINFENIRNTKKHLLTPKVIKSDLLNTLNSANRKHLHSFLEDCLTLCSDELSKNKLNVERKSKKNKNDESQNNYRFAENTNSEVPSNDHTSIDQSYKEYDIGKIKLKKNLHITKNINRSESFPTPQNGFFSNKQFSFGQFHREKTLNNLQSYKLPNCSISSSTSTESQNTITSNTLNNRICYSRSESNKGEGFNSFNSNTVHNNKINLNNIESSDIFKNHIIIISPKTEKPENRLGYLRALDVLFDTSINRGLNESPLEFVAVRINRELDSFLNNSNDFEKNSNSATSALLKCINIQTEKERNLANEMFSINLDTKFDMISEKVSKRTSIVTTDQYNLSKCDLENNHINNSDIIIISQRNTSEKIKVSEKNSPLLPKRPGVLIISEFSGCSSALPGILRINPWNIHSMALTLEKAIRQVCPKKSVISQDNFLKNAKFVGSMDLVESHSELIIDIRRVQKWKYDEGWCNLPSKDFNKKQSNNNKLHPYKNYYSEIDINSTENPILAHHRQISSRSGIVNDPTIIPANVTLRMLQDSLVCNTGINTTRIDKNIPSMAFCPQGFGMDHKVLSMERNIRQLKSDMLYHAYYKKKRRLFLFDFEGTLPRGNSEVWYSNAAGHFLIQYPPSNELKEMLRALSSQPNNTVVILSGRDRDSVSRWFQNISPRLILSAEHGYYLWLPSSLRDTLTDIVETENLNEQEDLDFHENIPNYCSKNNIHKDKDILDKELLSHKVFSKSELKSIHEESTPKIDIKLISSESIFEPNNLLDTISNSIGSFVNFSLNTANNTFLDRKDRYDTDTTPLSLISPSHYISDHSSDIIVENSYNDITSPKSEQGTIGYSSTPKLKNSKVRYSSSKIVAWLNAKPIDPSNVSQNINSSSLNLLNDKSLILSPENSSQNKSSVFSENQTNLSYSPPNHELYEKSTGKSRNPTEYSNLRHYHKPWEEDWYSWDQPYEYIEQEKNNQSWLCLGDPIGSLSWRKPALQIILPYVIKIQGSNVECKGASLVWEYHLVHPELGERHAKELCTILSEKFDEYDIVVENGTGYVEIKPSGLNKGSTVHHVVKLLSAIYNEAPDFILCVGNDRTDEDMFKAVESLQTEAKLTNIDEDTFSELSNIKNTDKLNTYITCTVGRKPSFARYFYESPDQVLESLKELLQTSANDYDLKLPIYYQKCPRVRML